MCFEVTSNQPSTYRLFQTAYAAGSRSRIANWLAVAGREGRVDFVATTHHPDLLASGKRIRCGDAPFATSDADFNQPSTRVKRVAPPLLTSRRHRFAHFRKCYLRPYTHDGSDDDFRYLTLPHCPLPEENPRLQRCDGSVDLNLWFKKMLPAFQAHNIRPSQQGPLFLFVSFLHLHSLFMYIML